MELLLTLMVHYSLVLDASENFVVIYVNLYLCSVVSYSLLRLIADIGFFVLSREGMIMKFTNLSKQWVTQVNLTLIYNSGILYVTWNRIITSRFQLNWV